MTIREIKKDEIDKLLSLYKDLHDTDDISPSPQTVESVWEEIQNDKNIVYFGLFNGKELISSCTIVLVPNLTRSCRPYCVIENVVTHKEHRRNGFGRTILNKAIDYAWENNCYKIMLMTGRLREETFRFYESVGFDRKTKQAFIMKR